MRYSIATIRRLYRDRSASAAVQFAFVAPFFFGTIFAIMESGFLFFATQTLETATQDTARLIMTNQAQDAKFNAANFKASLCSRVYGLFDCAGGITVDVQSFPSFSKVSLTDPIDSSKNFTKPSNYNAGNPGDVVIVRTFYEWPLIVLGLGFDSSNLAGGTKRLLMATAAFRNEPK